MDLKPNFRITGYEDEIGTVMRPIAGAVHNDEFKICTVDAPDSPGFKPYLQALDGFKGKIDPIEKKVEGENLDVTVIDPVVSFVNAERWLSAFLGDEQKKGRCVGRVFYIEQYIKDQWKPYAVYRLEQAEQLDPVTWKIGFRDQVEDFSKTKLFVGKPHPNARNHAQISYCPLGLTATYAGVGINEYIRAKTSWQDGKLQLDTMKPDRRSYSNMFVLESTSGVAPLKNALNYGMLKNIDLRCRFIDPAGTAPWHRKEAKIVYAKLGNETGNELQRWLTTSTPLLEWHWWRMEDLPEGDAAYIKTTTIPIGAIMYFQIIRGDEVGVDGNFGKWGLLITDGPINIILEDVLSGYYGYINDLGEPISRFEYDLSSVNWSSFPNVRWRIKEADKELAEWLEDNICKPFHLGYRWEVKTDGPMPKSVIRFFDMRYETQRPLITETPRITEDDIPYDKPPIWRHQKNGAASVITIKSALEIVRTSGTDSRPFDLEGPVSGNGKGLKDLYNLPEDFLDSQQVRVSVFDASQASPVGDGEFEIDASCIAGTLYKKGAGPLSPEVITDGANSVRGRLYSLAQNYVPMLFGGPMFVDLEGLRASASIESCKPGEWRIIDLPSLANVSTNKRGGERLMICIQREDLGSTVRLQFLDYSKATVDETTPTISGAAANANQTSATFTLGGLSAGEKAEIQIAYLPFGSSAPGSGSTLWQALDSGDGRVAYEAGTITGQWAQAGIAVYLRARKVGSDSATKGPWSSPVAVTGISAIPSPSGLAATTTATTATLTWTNGSPTLPIQVSISQAGGAYTPLATLPEGATSYTLTQLNAYEAPLSVQIRHIHTTGTLSNPTTVSLTLGGTTPTETSPDIASISIAKGRAPTDPSVPGAGSGDADFAIQIKLIPGKDGVPIEVQRAPSLGGSPDTANAETLTFIASPFAPAFYTDLAPDDDTTVYYYRARHLETGKIEGPWTPWLAAIAILVDTNELNAGGSGGDQRTYVSGDVQYRKDTTKIIGPLTEIQFRNRADTQTNLKIEDDGDVQVRGNLEVLGTNGVKTPKVMVGADQVVGARQTGPGNLVAATGTPSTVAGSASAPSGTPQYVSGSANSAYTAVEQGLINNLMAANNNNAAAIASLLSVVSAQATLINGLVAAVNANATSGGSVSTQYNDAVTKLNSLLTALRTHGLIS